LRFDGQECIDDVWIEMSPGILQDDVASHVV
jgi:hypothetical protein